MPSVPKYLRVMGIPDNAVFYHKLVATG